MISSEELALDALIGGKNRLLVTANIDALIILAKHGIDKTKDVLQSMMFLI